MDESDIGHDPFFVRVAFPSPNYSPLFSSILSQTARPLAPSLAGPYNVTGNLITIERQR